MRRFCPLTTDAKPCPIAPGSERIGCQQNRPRVSPQVSVLLPATEPTLNVAPPNGSFLLPSDSREGTIERRERIPIRLNSVSTSPGASVASSSLQTYKVGLSVKASVREVSDELVRLVVNCSSSDLTEFTGDGLPRIKTDEVDVSADVVNGGVYLLGSLRRESLTAGRGKWLQWGDKVQRDGAVVQVWARVFRVGVPVERELPGGVAPVSAKSQALGESDVGRPADALNPENDY